MFSFLKKFANNKEAEVLDIDITEFFDKLKKIYNPDSVSSDRKDYIKNIIEDNGYLPYPHTEALKLSPAEVLYGLTIKWNINNTFDSEKNIFKIENNKISPAQRADYKNSDWIKKEQHNIKLINLAGLGNGNETKDTGKFIDWLRQLLILPAGKPDRGVLGTTIYLIPFHPREFGCAYLPASTEVSPQLEDKNITEKTGLDVKQQVQIFIKMAQLAGHCVIYDVLPQTGRFSKMVLANPEIARWYDIKTLIRQISEEADTVAEEIKKDFDAEDVDIVLDIYKSTLKKGSNSLSEHYQHIYDKFEEIIAPKKKEFSEAMLKKEQQLELHKKAKEISAEINGFKTTEQATEESIVDQKATVKALIKQGLWPAPGGAWCSCGIPVFNKMSTSGEYPTFRHFDYKGEDVTHFANLDCQTPYYFVYLESGEYNEPVIQEYINYLKKLQRDFNFDGFRVDHIDHIVDRVSEDNGIPISYRAPRKVLGRANKEMKSLVPHFATLAEYMLWDKFFKEYHEDMNFDILWGNDIISQFCKTPESITYDNQDLESYNASLKEGFNNLSILKTYNNQDGEFRDIDQYPGQLGKQGALFKWFKYKFLPGGKNAQRPVMFIDGDESFTKTGIERVIGAEVSMKRNNDIKFFNQFNAINKFALNNVLTREGEARIIDQHDDGFVCWMISKEPLKESLIVAANYKAPTEKVNDNGNIYTKNGESVFDKTINLPCDYIIEAEYLYKDSENIGEGCFEENKFESKETTLHFEELKPSEFKIYKIKK